MLRIIGKWIINIALIGIVLYLPVYVLGLANFLFLIIGGIVLCFLLQFEIKL